MPLFDHDRAFGPGDVDPMAKMFYSAEEAADKLGKSVDELTAMAKSGEVQSFKQDDQDMFRVEQIEIKAVRMCCRMRAGLAVFATTLAVAAERC